MINAVNVAKGYKVISKQRPQIIEDVDKLLPLFINEKQWKVDSLSKAFICENALDIYGDLVKKTLCASSKDFDIKSSRVWFKCLRKEVEFTVYLDMERRQVQAKKRQRSLKKEFSDLMKQKVSSHNRLLLLLLSRLINRQDVVFHGLGRRSPYRFHCQCGQLRYRRHTEAESRSSIAGIGRSATKKDI